MNAVIGNKETTPTLKRYLSPVAVWALAFGCAVGWGAFVMPGTTFLPTAGSLGSVLGIILGGFVMLIIGYNYAYLIKRYPDSGGIYAFVKNIFGYDHGFLGAWFVILVYVAIIWANTTAISLIAGKFFGEMFHIGYLYTAADYDVYLGEALLSLAGLAIGAIICIRGGKFAANAQICGAAALVVGIATLFALAVHHAGFAVPAAEPTFPANVSPLAAIFGIVVLSPWAFVGFESIAQSTEEFSFSPQKIFKIIGAAIFTAIFAYTALIIIAVSVTHPFFNDWYGYITNIDKIKGISGLPTLYAADRLLPGAGLIIIVLAIAGGVLTGLVGNFIAASRLIFAMTRDNLLPAWFAKLSENRTPVNAVLFLFLLSLPIPFCGRTAIGWIVDVNTVGATIAYAYVSAAAFTLARREKNVPVKITGILGTLISGTFFIYFMLPNFWDFNALSTESYLILILWSILGFGFFRYIFKRDSGQRFGKSTIVWLALVFLVFFTSAMWLREATHNLTKSTLTNLNAYYMREFSRHDTVLTNRERNAAEFYLEAQLNNVSNRLMEYNVIQVALIILTLLIMFHIYHDITNREMMLAVEKKAVEKSSKAKSTFFFNMSHDIRTPMNAIIGYTNIIKKEPGLSPKIADYLSKIEVSGNHLLDLINDVLEMSRIENGKLELQPTAVNLPQLFAEVRDLFATQMEAKGLQFTVSTEDVRHKTVLCDGKRLNRVLLNLISNAYKFTPEGGAVNVTLTEATQAPSSETDDGYTTTEKAAYEMRVKDSGMGMSKEFAAKVFEAYERDRAANNIQGTGLGTAITKSIIDLMGGTITVETELGKGSEFIINVALPITEDTASTPETTTNENASLDFSDIRILLVEDVEVNREIATLILSEFGFEMETAENGKIAVEKIKEKPADYYDVILMDVQMPVMDGYAATKAIRRLPDAQKAALPIIAMTANAFAEDVDNAKAAGMNGHIAKPLDVPQMMKTLTEVLQK